jgi:hypothetical protein
MQGAEWGQVENGVGFDEIKGVVSRDGVWFGMFVYSHAWRDEAISGTGTPFCFLRRERMKCDG